MTELKTDKKAESIKALKDANKHLADLFSDLAKKDNVLRSTSSDLQYVANQCGDIQVAVYVGANRQVVSLKNYLGTCANTLENAR